MGNDKDRTQMSQHETKALQAQDDSGGTGGTGQGGQGQGRDYGQTNQGQGGYGQTGQTGTHEWDTEHGDDMTRGDRTDPAQPDGTTPFERDQRPINQSG